MSLKTGLNLTKNYSINFNLPKRQKKKIKFIVIHYTGMKVETSSIKRLCDPKSKVSCHYFIKNNGQILELVPDLFEAWHAGQSKWKNYKSLNKYSIGIEIQNPGHEHGYKKFNKKQVSSIIKILKYLIKKYKIKFQNVLGHSDIAPFRKKDPGEKFPWRILAKKKLCHWHNYHEIEIFKSRRVKITNLEKEIFLKNLYKIGYGKLKKSSSIKDKKNLTKAFQRRFRQGLVNGEADQECLLISKNLLKS